MAVHSVLDYPGARDVWDFLKGEYDDVVFRVAANPVEEDGLSNKGAGLRPAHGNSPAVLRLANGAQQLYKALCSQAGLKDNLDQREDVTRWLAFVLLHELGHHVLGHTKWGDAEQTAADNWARGEYSRLAGAGHVPETTAEKLELIVRVANRGGGVDVPDWRCVR